MAHNLPVERPGTHRATAGELARDDVVTCALSATVGDVAPQIAESAYGFALVTTRGGVLLGRLRKSLCDVDPDTAVERVMESGPSTVRPDLLAEELAGRLRERDLKTAVVSTPEGVLIGVVRRSELKKAS